MLTPSEYAEANGKPYQTIMAWLRKGLIAGAEKATIGKMVFYQIPEDAKFIEPPMGRPKKTTDEGAAEKQKPAKKALKSGN